MRKTYSHKNPEKCDGQVGARQQSVHVERDYPSEHSRDPHDHFDHLSEMCFSDCDALNGQKLNVKKAEEDSQNTL